VSEAKQEEKKKPPGRLSRLAGLAFSPRGLLLRAAIISFVYLAARLAGLREYTTIISGTSPTGDVTDWWSAGLGVVYVTLYLGFVLLVPVLLIAAALLTAWFRFAPRGK